MERPSSCASTPPQATSSSNSDKEAPMSFPAHLSDAAIENFGRELDAIRDEVMDSRGDRDRRYLLRLIRIQRGLALGGRLVIFGSLAFLPEWLIALHDLEINRLLAGKRTLAEIYPMLRRIGQKVAHQTLKDYVLWPLLAGPFFLHVLAANAVANVVRNVWAYVIIFCGHFPEGVHYFSEEEVVDETRARWYVRQLLGSCNIDGGRLFHVFSGNLSPQIEHHLFP